MSPMMFTRRRHWSGDMAVVPPEGAVAVENLIPTVSDQRRASRIPHGGGRAEPSPALYRLHRAIRHLERALSKFEKAVDALGE